MKTILMATTLILMTQNLLWAGEKPLHLFILSGQSNMANLRENVGFQPEIEKLCQTSETVVVKFARSGHPIRCWLKNYDSIAAKAGIDPTTIDRSKDSERTDMYPLMLDKIHRSLPVGKVPDTITFCWMQGERDAKEQLSKPYEAALRELIDRFKTDLSQPKMNVVIGRLSDHLLNKNEHWDAIRQLQVQMTESDPMMAWVDCDDLNDKINKSGETYNDLHYNKEGYVLMGERMARQAWFLINGSKPALNGRPEIP